MKTREAQKKQRQRHRQKEGLTTIQMVVPLADLASTLLVHGLLPEKDIEDREAITSAYELFTQDLCRVGRKIPLILEDRTARSKTQPSPQTKSSNPPYRRDKELAQRRLERGGPSMGAFSIERVSPLDS